MTVSPGNPASGDSARSLFRFRMAHLAAVPLFVAFAMLNIRDHGIRDPGLLAIAGAGFLAYGLIGRFGWALADRAAPPGSRRRLAAVAFYLAAMALIFGVACFVYVAIEARYLGA